MRYALPLTLLSGTVLTACSSLQPRSIGWPAAAGPMANWTVNTTVSPPERFSVTTGENLLWRTALPEGGQSGMAVSGDRLYLSIIKPIDAVHSKADLMVHDIVALCVDARDGRILWQRVIAGTVPSEAMYGFSDSSTPTPATDGAHVVFTNASGQMSCFDMDGGPLWSRIFRPVEQLDGVTFPFNKQFEPILSAGLIVNMEPDWDGLCGPKGWNHLVALDVKTGERRWISEDPLTHYNTPQLTSAPDGTPAILIGRGGHHGVPEAPVGCSLIRLADGKRIWAQAVEGSALYHASSDGQVAVWMSESANAVRLLDLATGEPIQCWSLTKSVTWRPFDAAAGRHVERKAVDLEADEKNNVFPAWFSNIVVDGQLFFLCFKSGPFKQGIGPAYCAGRLNLATGRMEYLELPTDVVRQPNGDQWCFATERLADTRNSRGWDVAHDPRSKRDGWHWNFNANPVAVGHRIHYTLMNGMAYCLATDTPDFDASALVSVNDLGPSGGVWSLSSPAIAEGRMYHRSLRELICIGRKP